MGEEWRNNNASSVPGGPYILPAMPRPRAFLRPLLLASFASLTAACTSVGRVLEEVFRERPPSPVDRITTASDARIDSAGRLVGSFVGEGTSRAVHLLSSDTALIADLVRRYAPRRATDPWEALERAGMIRIPLRLPKEEPERGALVARARVASPAGRTGVVATSILVRSGRCKRRGAQAEIVVEELERQRGPALRGPVVGSLVAGSGGTESFQEREAPPAPSDSLIRILVDRTRRAIDSTLATRYRKVEAHAIPDGLLEVNTLADIDAADIVPYHVDGGRVRYAVSLRERRVSRGDTLVVAGVMAWDSAGAWQQTVFRPTFLFLRRGRLEPYEPSRGIYWRRLSAVSDFAGYGRDNLWMEQVDVRTASVLWGIVQPSDNVVVAAAEMEGPCR